MKNLRKHSKRLIALAMTFILVLSMGTISAFAAENRPKDGNVSPCTVIPSFGNQTCTAYVYSPVSDKFVVRANQTISITINIVSKSSDALGFFYQLVKDSESVNSEKVNQSGSTTLHITLEEGGTYYFLFGCMRGSYTFNYTITI